MRSSDPGLNKPFDRIVKAFADEAPRLFLKLLGIVNADDAVITPLRAETAPPIVLPDFVVRVLPANGTEVILHVEFQLKYDRGLPRRMARYGASLSMQYGLRVISVLVLMREGRAPGKADVIERHEGFGTVITHPYKVVKLWEVDPAPLLLSTDPRQLPWALLMRSTDAEVRDLAAIVARSGDDESIGRFLTLGSLRYHRNVLQEMLGGVRMGLVEVILEGSSLVQEVKDRAAAEGRAEGQAQGQAAGQVNGARLMLRESLRAKFDGLESMPEIDRITSIEALQNLLVNSVLNNADRSLAQKAIRAAARKVRA